jgi:hypothetical protein
MSTGGDANRRLNRTQKLIAAVEELARGIGVQDGKFSIVLCHGEVVKIKITLCMVFALSSAQWNRSTPRKRKAPVARRRILVDIENVQLKEVLTALLDGSQIRFGTIRLDLKQGNVHRVWVALSYLLNELDELDTLLFGC